MADLENVVFVDDTVKKVQALLIEVQKLVKSQVLPKSRYPITKRLIEAAVMTEQVLELLNRSGMSRRLGFRQQDGVTQPVMLGPRR